MSTEEIPHFTPERILQQAQGNTTAIICTTIAYLKEQGLPLDDYASFVGRRFASTWESMQAATAKEVAEMAALNLVSGGAQLLHLTGDEQQAEAVLTNAPPLDFLDFAGISYADADTFNDVFHGIADALGLHFEQQRTGEQIRLRFSR